MDLSAKIKQKAIDSGFDLVGITDASPLGAADCDYLQNWLNSGHAGQMAYMHRNLAKRLDPSKLLNTARSVIVTGLNYKPPTSEKAAAKTPTGKIANYAQYEDYHQFIKGRLFDLANYISSLAKRDLKFKICVDSAPIAERALAQRAGLGFIGKNHMLINPQFGPEILLGEIITDLKLKPDTPLEAECAACNKCIAACPTGALADDGRFDASKCISYLTIEHKGDIEQNLAVNIGDKLFGCDLCVSVCPHCVSAPLCSNKQFRFEPDLAEMDLNEILNMTDSDFENRFANSSLKRIGLQRLKRNANICLKNLSISTNFAD